MGQSVGGNDISLHLTSFGGERGVPFQQAMYEKQTIMGVTSD